MNGLMSSVPIDRLSLLALTQRVGTRLNRAAVVEFALAFYVVSTPGQLSLEVDPPAERATEPQERKWISSTPAPVSATRVTLTYYA
jgi:hypothetical protein